jgi:hypothetical protein
VVLPGLYYHFEVMSHSTLFDVVGVSVVVCIQVPALAEPSTFSTSTDEGLRARY